MNCSSIPMTNVHGFTSLASSSHDQPPEYSIHDSETMNGQGSVVSDCESSCSGDNSGCFGSLDDGLIPLFQGDKVYDLIKGRFLSTLGLLGKQATVVSIRRNSFSGVMGQAKIQSFHVFTKATETKCGGNANVKYAWFGCDSIDDCSKIMKYGFSQQFVNQAGFYGHGVYLSPDNSSIECVKNSSVDEDGLRHLLLCRVILGKPEVVHPGSEQREPSSEAFDSAVDSLTNPKKVIVWSTHMNTHILPEFVISFKAPSSLKGYFKNQEAVKRPTSPWMPFPLLIKELSKFLPSASVGLIANHHKQHKENRISREEMIQKVRLIAGDKLLISVIKAFRDKVVKQVAARSS